MDDIHTDFTDIKRITKELLFYSFPRATIKKVLQTGQLKTTEMHSLMVLEARSPKSRYQQNHIPSETE